MMKWIVVLAMMPTIAIAQDCRLCGQKTSQHATGLIVPESYKKTIEANSVFPQDPTGFTQALNISRVKHGLSSVRFNADSLWISHRNNDGIRAGLIPHNFTGGLAQCAAIATGDTISTLNAWLASTKGHREILLAPGLLSVGFVGDGYCSSVACDFGAAGSPPIATPQPQYRLFRRHR